MRLHRLGLTAFGSFPGEEEVDFDALGEAGLFLVHGPTGAGKTTVLDAVCYALYGRVPGRRDNARSLRCDHAPAGRGPSVVLEVTIRGRRFRITRSPMWRRPKLRGTGTVEEKAKALLEEFTGDWIARSTRSDEAGHMIGELLGMNADQFCQVAMLPQGDFARFLRADGDDRRKLLERLFSVKIFTDVEKWLADHRTRTGRERQELQHEVDSVVNQMRGAAGDELLSALITNAERVPVADVELVPVADVELVSEADANGNAKVLAEAVTEVEVDAAADPVSWSDALLGVAGRAMARAAEAGTASLATLGAARGRLEDGRALSDRQRRHAEAIARRDELDRAAEERSDLESILDEAARADRVLPLIRQAGQRAETAAKARRQAVDAVDRALPLTGGSAGGVADRPASRPRGGMVGGPDGSVGGPDGGWVGGPDRSDGGLVGGSDGGPGPCPDAAWLSGLERDRRDEIARLEQLLPEEPRLATVRTDLRAAERTLTDLVGQENGLAERLAVLPGERKSAEERLAAARLAEARITGLRAARDFAERDLAAVRHRDTVAVDLALAVAATTAALSVLPDTAELAPVRLPSLGSLEKDGTYAVVTGSLEKERTLAGLLAELERARRDELARLELLASEENRLEEVRDQLAEARAEFDCLTDRDAAVRTGQADLPAVLAEAAERLTRARDGIARVPVLEAGTREAHERLDAVVLRDALTSELAVAEEIRRAAVDDAQALRDRFQDVRRARIDGMAAELARELAVGEPCRVCGSVEHPAPAAPAASAPTEDDEQAAHDAFEAARQSREEAENEVVRLSSRLDDVTPRADGLGRGEAQALLVEAEAELTEARAVAAEEPGISGALQRLTAELDALRDDAQEVGRALAECRAREGELMAEHGRLTTRLAAAYGEDGGISARRVRIDAEAALLSTAIVAVDRAMDRHDAYVEAADAVAKLTEDLRARRRAELGEALPQVPADASEHDLDNRLNDILSSLPDCGSGQGEVLSEELAAWILVGAEEDFRQAQEMAAEEPGLAADAARLAIEIAEAEGVSRRTALDVAQMRSRCGQLAEEECRLASALEAACGEDASLTARLERLTDEAALLRDAAEATNTATTADLEKDAALAEAESASAEAGFATVEDAAAAARTHEERAAMAERLQRSAGEQAAVAEILGDPELVAAAAMPPPDLVAIDADHAQAEREHAARASAHDRAQGRLDQLTGLARELGDAIGRYDPAAERHRLARRLAELAGGTSADNQWHMRLSSYVLGERLRQVVDAANERLDHMSGGRYLLRHDMGKVAGDRGRSGGGLGLLVLDGWTGVDRDPATLSGGESFITSLALALGLADVVTDEAGGAEIGSLFVDEGFGTLDEDTLDDVLDILDGLREGGRAVGIVSHVAELRVRIPAQLQVIKRRSGSTLQLT